MEGNLLILDFETTNLNVRYRRLWPPKTFPRPFWLLPLAGLILRFVREFRGVLGRVGHASVPKLYIGCPVGSDIRSANL